MHYKQRQKRKKHRRAVILITSLVLILGYIFFFSPVFKDKKIDSGEIEHGERIAIVCKDETAECFYIDKQGIAFEQAPQTSGSLVLLIKDYSEREYHLGKEIFEQRIVNFISQVRYGLSSEAGLAILDFNVLSFPPKDLKVMTNEGWYILFDLERDIKSQLLGLKAALEEKISEEERKNLEYVDLRIENRIYYK